MTHPYASAAYAEAFPSDYEPIFLPQAHTHVLKRRIPGTDHVDAIGIYPLCPIKEAADLQEDFALLQEQNVLSLVLVADPFFHPPLETLQQHFDKVTLFKEHFLHDFSKDRAYSKHHRYEVRRAQAQCQTKIIALADYLEEWQGLYDLLVAKHGITGIQAFSRDYFAAIARLNPVMIGAFTHDELISAHLWFAHEAYVYSHLAASSEEGYRLRAAYAVYDASLQYFAAKGARVLDLGAGAGIAEASKGLEFLKAGFSNAKAPCYLCGKILDQAQYAALSVGRNTSYFPAYRAAA